MNGASGVDAGERENDRQYGLVDQLVTMHAQLRDRYMRRSTVLSTGQIAISLFLCVVAFIVDDVLVAMGYSPPAARFVLGFAAAGVLVLSIVEFRVDWRAAASRHADAVGELGALKAEYRRFYVESQADDHEKDGVLTGKFEGLVGRLPPIPERDFVRLKARHQYKRILSELVSRDARAPVWLLRLRLRVEGIGSALGGRRLGNEGKGDARDG